MPHAVAVRRGGRESVLGRRPRLPSGRSGSLDTKDETGEGAICTAPEEEEARAAKPAHRLRSRNRKSRRQRKRCFPKTTRLDEASNALHLAEKTIPAAEASLRALMRYVAARRSELKGGAGGDGLPGV